MPHFSATITNELTQESFKTEFRTESFSEAAFRLEELYKFISARRLPSEGDIAKTIMDCDPSSIQGKMRVLTIECRTMGEVKAALRVARSEGSLKGYDARYYHQAFTQFLQTQEALFSDRKALPSDSHSEESGHD